MGKYKLVLRRMTQVEMSIGIMRSRFETYPPQQFNLTDVLDTPITLGSHVVASGPRTLEEKIESVFGLATGPGRRTSRQSKRGGVYPCCEVFQR